MTAPVQPTGPVVVVPERDSRLDQLAARYDAVKARADAAAAELAEVKEAIKSELATAPGAGGEAVLRSEHLYSPLRLHAVTSWRVDAKSLKASAPEVYVQYARQSTSWRLDVVK